MLTKIYCFINDDYDDPMGMVMSEEGYLFMVMDSVGDREAHKKCILESWEETTRILGTEDWELEWVEDIEKHPVAKAMRDRVESGKQNLFYISPVSAK